MGRNRTRSQNALVRRQLDLLVERTPIDAIDAKNLDLVTAAIARLLLEAAAAASGSEEVPDDAS